MPETEPLIIDLTVEDINAEGVVDSSPLQNSNLSEIKYLFKALGEVPPTVAAEFYFSGTNISVFRELDITLPAASNVELGQVFSLTGPRAPYGLSLFQLPVAVGGPSQIEWGAATGTITVTRLEGSTATFRLDVVTSEAIPSERKPIRIRGTITIDFDRQENVTPPF
jgi:hypothetical protein